MKAPAFWWEPPGFAARLLHPASLVYGAVAASRMRRTGVLPPVPVVCIGNMTVGGAGKTPTATAVAGLLRTLGHQPAFLLRGYGGRLRGPVRVEIGGHGANDVGDEALLLARDGPTVVSRDRPAGAALCTRIGADVIVMDDGLQNPSLAKTVSLAVFDGETGLGNGFVLPAGPLRAPEGVQWPLVDAVVIMGSGRGADRAGAAAAKRGRPAFVARILADHVAADAVRGRRVLAFAGIGRPGKFFATLGSLGAEVVAERAFPDHHVLSTAELAQLGDEAKRKALILVTTEKDAARLYPEQRRHLPDLLTLPVRATFDEPDRLRAWLQERLLAVSRRSPRSAS